MAFQTPYRDYDVLGKWHTPSWDDTTREVVRRRLEDVPRRTFLTADEWNTLTALCQRLVPQDEAAAVPIAPWVDEKLASNRGDGYRYGDMPPVREAWRQGLAAIDAESAARFGSPFHVLPAAQQDEVLRAIQSGDVRADAWNNLPPQRFFTSTLLKTVVGIYYSHPQAWSEVGFGGPASPRGYVRLGRGQHDPWEAAEQDA